VTGALPAAAHPKSVETDSNGKPLERASAASSFNSGASSLAAFLGGGPSGGATRTSTDAVHVMNGAKANAAASIDLSCIYGGGAATRTYEVTAPVPPLLTWLDMLLAAFTFVFQIAFAGLGRAGHIDPARHFPHWFSALTAAIAPQLSPAAFLLLAVIAGRVARAWAGTVPIESVTAIRGVGLQISTRPGRQWGASSPRSTSGIGAGTVRRVIDVNSIDALVIHESYYRHRCVYFLAVVVRDEPKSVVLFADTLPRLEALRVVLRGLRHVLYGSPEHGPTLGQADPDGLGDSNAASAVLETSAGEPAFAPGRSPTTTRPGGPGYDI